MPRGIYPRTKEHHNILKGRTLSEEHRRKISMAQKGKILSKEHIEKMSKALKGRIPWNLGKKLPPLSEEHKEKISNGMKGKQNTLGKSISEEHKRKISEANRKNPKISFWKGKKFSEDRKRNMSLDRIGHICSEETRRKIGEAQKGEKNHMFGMRGDKHHNWKGGLTPLMELIRRCFKNKQWRLDIYKRDNYTCILCGKRGGRLEVDHYPTKFSDIFYKNEIKDIEQALECEEFWDTSNGRTLCFSCHNGTKGI